MEIDLNIKRSLKILLTYINCLFYKNFFSAEAKFSADFVNIFGLWRMKPPVLNVFGVWMELK